MNTNVWKQRLLGVVLGLALVGGFSIAQDWYVASGKPVQRSQLNSSDFRTEFASIQSDIADQMPAITGNGDKVVVVNSGGTALTVATGGVAISGGGTGSTTDAGARTSLGVAIGSDVQAWDTDLDAIAALANTDSNFIVGNGSAWVAETAATARTSLAVFTTGDSPEFTAVEVGHASDTTLARSGAGVATIEGVEIATRTEGSFTVSFDAACTTTPTIDIEYVQVGESVTLTPSGAGAIGVTCTSDSTLFEETSASVPAALRPTNPVYTIAHALDTGSYVPACVRMLATGIIDVLRHDVTGLCNSATWTGSGVKNVTFGSFSYNLDN